MPPKTKEGMVSVHYKPADKPMEVFTICSVCSKKKLLHLPIMDDPDPPKQLPAPSYPPKTMWWKIKRMVGYPREIRDWDHFTWDETTPPNREKAFKETCRELRKPPQNILQDALEQLDTDHDRRLECIQKSTISLLAVSAYETQRATWWLQALTWILLILTTTLVIQTQTLISLETGKDIKEGVVDVDTHTNKDPGVENQADSGRKNLPTDTPPIQDPTQLHGSEQGTGASTR